MKWMRFSRRSRMCGALERPRSSICAGRGGRALGSPLSGRGGAQIHDRGPGTEVFDAVERRQVTAFEEDIWLQDLATLQLAKHIAKDREEAIGVSLIEDLAHLSIAGDGLQAEDSAQVVVQSPAL